MLQQHGLVVIINVSVKWKAIRRSWDSGSGEGDSIVYFSTTTKTTTTTFWCYAWCWALSFLPFSFSYLSPFSPPLCTICPGLACFTMKRLSRQARISLMLSINATFFVAEIAVGYYASSLALVWWWLVYVHQKVPLPITFVHYRLLIHSICWVICLVWQWLYGLCE